MSKADNGEGSENYSFTVTATPDEVVSKISNGEGDIAAVATNLASTLYNKTQGGVKVIAVNTMGALLSAAKTSINYEQVFAVTLMVVVLSILLENLLKLAWREQKR